LTLLFLFFFQAEDGIRDDLVTGVQTCALPIYIGYNLADHLDFQYLPGRKYDTFFDPEGLLSTIPAIATCLLGVFAGFLLRNQTVSDLQKVAYLMIFGVAAACAGWLWNFQFPVVKKIWTSSYVLVAGGYSAMV